MTSKFALIIANTEYQDASFAKLTAPGKDAEEFAHILREPELAAFDDVQVLLNEGEGKTRRSIARFFAERKRDDLLLLYFSGHGVRNELGQLFLAANDTEISILEASGIPAEFVTQSMNNSRSQRQLLILDCCNSGAFAHGSKSASGVGKSMGIATAFEGSGFGRVVLTATDATQYAWEGDKVIGDTQKSVFTHFLIEGLKGEADRDGDGRIHVDELYDYAYEQVVSRTPKQTPGKWSYKQQGDIILRGNLKPREIKPAPLPPELLEMLAHPNSGVRRAGLQELIGLLDSKHQGLARAAREKLREIAENDDSLTLRRTVSDVLKARGFVLEQVIEQGDFYSFQQGPVPDSIETPKEEQKEEKKIEKPASEAASPAYTAKFSQRKWSASEDPLKSITSKFNLRLVSGIIGSLLIITLCAWGGVNIWNNLFSATLEPTRISQPTATQTFPPESNIPMPTNTSIHPTPTLKVTLLPTEIFTNTVTVELTPITALIMASEGGGAFIREKPGGIVLATLANGASVIIVPNDIQEVNSVIWVHVIATVNNVRVEGWMIQSVLTTVTTSSENIISPKDGMTLLYVPAGEFTMGSDSSDQSDEKPEHQVDLDAFWIDKTEVTNAMYEKCVADGACKEPTNASSYTHSSYYGNSEFDDYPVLYVDWNMASAYCSWADRRLPTEAEWEKAARGPGGDVYPWGNESPNTNLLNYNSNVGDTTKVGAYTNGESVYGALDMAGNVWEWVSSLYQSYPYNADDGRENLTSSDARVLWGGSWVNLDNLVRSASRNGFGPTSAVNFLGFRCSRSR